MPLEVRRALGALLDVVSRLSQLLPKAGHILEQLPEFLRTYKVTTLLDVPDVPDFDQVGVCSGRPGHYSDLLRLCICLSLSSHLKSACGNIQGRECLLWPRGAGHPPEASLSRVHPWVLTHHP